MSATAGGVISALSFTPIKGTRVHPAERLELGRAGAVENRRFFLIDGRDRMVNGKQLGALQALIARFNEAERRLELEFPSGEIVAGEVDHAGELAVRFFSRTRSARLIEGPWADALSEFLGQPVRLMEALADGTAVDRGRAGAVSLISRGSLRRLAETSAEPEVDARRFRMLVEVDGIAPHEEDGWVDRVVTLGGARIRFRGHVGRCLVTTRHPDTGEVDVPVLDFLWDSRREQPTTEPLAFGIYGEVLSGGPIAVGDRVAPEPV